jgi:hypothetical protein
MINQNIYDDYAIKPGSPKSFFIRAAELLGQMDIDGKKVEKTPEKTAKRCTPMMGKVWIGLSLE